MNKNFNVCRNVVLLLAASIFFGLFNSFFAWFAFVPVLFLIKNTSLKNCWIYGGIYGLLSYTFFVPWLVKYSFAAMAGVWAAYFIFWAVVFILFKLSDIFCGKSSFILQFVLLLSYEYIKTKGFLGFNYGVNGYTQWKNIYLIQTADFAGVWGITALVDFCSFVIYFILSDIISSFTSHGKLKLSSRSRICLFTETVLVLFSLIYGFVRINQIEKRDAGLPVIKILSVQHNTDPWENGLSAYWKDYAVLKELTEAGLKNHPETDIVLWPETAIVPSIKNIWHSGKDEKRMEFVDSLLNYIESKNCGFVIGNYDYDMDEDKDYNSVFLFVPGKNVIPPEPDTYSKIHLVPFSEYFPYEKQFPSIYKKLLEGDTHLWTPGKEYKVFDYNGFKFSTPVCFEDTFGNECRKFRKNGAGAFLNLSNDAWASSKRCQKQHLMMAVFRSVENRIPSVRSSVSGETCCISSTGKITSRCKSFTEDYLYCEIPVLVALE